MGTLRRRCQDQPSSRIRHPVRKRQSCSAIWISYPSQGYVFTARQSQHLPTTGFRRSPGYIFVGDQPGESEIRLGIFAGLRGEDNVGAKAIVDFIDDLVAMPSLGSAFRIYAYPTVNPLSYRTGARGKRRPFELALRIPRSGWHGLYSFGLRIALHTAVEQYRSYLAQANNIRHPTNQTTHQIEKTNH